MKRKDIPKEIWINNEPWRIVFVPKRKLKYRNEQVLGLTDPSTRTISIITGLSYILRAEIFAHELMHAINFEYGFETKHDHIYKFGEAFAQVWVDNF